jgi:hypothetical protein
MPPVEKSEQREPADRISLRWAIEIVICLGTAYAMLHPDALERLEEAVATARDRVRRAVSVWRARCEIRDLPETTKGGATPGCDGKVS